MSRKGYEGEGVPDRLQNKTIETILPDILYVPAVDSFTGMNEVFYIDKNQASGLGRLVVDGRQDLRLVKSTDSLGEMVVLMKVWVQTDEGELNQYIIADCRHYYGQFEVSADDPEVDFTDQETAWGEIDYRQHQVVISAVIDYEDEDGDGDKIRVWGDSNLYDAAICMAGMVDELFDSGASAESAEDPEESGSSRARGRVKGSQYN